MNTDSLHSCGRVTLCQKQRRSVHCTRVSRNGCEIRWKRGFARKKLSRRFREANFAERKVCVEGWQITTCPPFASILHSIHLPPPSPVLLLSCIASSRFRTKKYFNPHSLRTNYSFPPELHRFKPRRKMSEIVPSLAIRCADLSTLVKSPLVSKCTLMINGSYPRKHKHFIR